MHMRGRPRSCSLQVYRYPTGAGAIPPRIQRRSGIKLVAEQCHIYELIERRSGLLAVIFSKMNEVTEQVDHLRIVVGKTYLGGV